METFSMNFPRLKRLKQFSPFLQEFCFMKTQLLTRSASNDDILSDRKGFFEQSEFTYEKTPFHNLHAADKETEDAKKYDYFDDEDDDDDEDDIPGTFLCLIVRGWSGHFATFRKKITLIAFYNDSPIL